MRLLFAVALDNFKGRIEAQYNSVLPNSPTTKVRRGTYDSQQGQRPNQCVQS